MLAPTTVLAADPFDAFGEAGAGDSFTGFESQAAPVPAAASRTPPPSYFGGSGGDGAEDFGGAADWAQQLPVEPSASAVTAAALPTLSPDAFAIGDDSDATPRHHQQLPPHAAPLFGEAEEGGAAATTVAGTSGGYDDWPQQGLVSQPSSGAAAGDWPVASVSGGSTDAYALGGGSAHDAHASPSVQHGGHAAAADAAALSTPAGAETSAMEPLSDFSDAVAAGVTHAGSERDAGRLGFAMGELGGPFDAAPAASSPGAALTRSVLNTGREGSLTAGRTPSGPRTPGGIPLTLDNFEEEATAPAAAVELGGAGFGEGEEAESDFGGGRRDYDALGGLGGRGGDDDTMLGGKRALGVDSFADEMGEEEETEALGGDVQAEATGLQAGEAEEEHFLGFPPSVPSPATSPTRAGGGDAYAAAAAAADDAAAAANVLAAAHPSSPPTGHAATLIEGLHAANARAEAAAEAEGEEGVVTDLLQGAPAPPSPTPTAGGVPAASSPSPFAAAAAAAAAASLPSPIGVASPRLSSPRPPMISPRKAADASTTVAPQAPPAPATAPSSGGRGGGALDGLSALPPLPSLSAPGSAPGLLASTINSLTVCWEPVEGATGELCV